ncbi:MAG: DUF1552 domain-containing protein [Myxococcales bacterium]|nr:DUF1552 domain-containing protein [Myxococcales bacterium]
MKIDPIGRRMFLQGASGLLLAAPFLPSLLPRGVKAQSLGNARRFVAIKSYSTQLIANFYPSYSGNGYSTRPYDSGDGKADGTTLLTQSLSQSSGRHKNGNEYFAKWAPLSDLAQGGALSDILGPAFNPFLERMLLLRGLDFMPDTNHNEGGMLGNYAAADVQHTDVVAWPTIDQVLAYSSKFYPSPPSGTRALHLSPGRSNTFSFTDGGTGGPISQVQAHVDPQTAFNEAFANYSPPAAMPAGPDPNKRLIDRVLEDYRRVVGGPRIGAADRQTLEQHIAYMSELSTRLDASAPAVSCDQPTEPPSVQANGVDPAVLTQAFELMVDVAVAALRCDVTRIVTLNVWKGVARGIGAGGSDVGYVHSGLKDAQDWHERAHEFDTPGSRDQVLAINQWIAGEVVARMLAGLDVDEGDGSTFLDNSIVFWGNELGMNHLNWSVPSVLFGSGGGHLQTGRYIDYIDWNQNVKFHQEDGPVIEGVPYNRLMVSLLQAFGLSPEDYERGAPGYGSYSTSGKTTDLHAIDYDASQYGNPLPGLTG